MNAIASSLIVKRNPRFELRLTNARVGRNLKDPGTDVPIPARATVRFKSGKIMTRRVLLRTAELSKSAKKRTTI